MATVNKDFKIKSGLIVEGTTATVNGHNILTESTSGDQYILNLIGGETLVKSVSGNLSVDGSGDLSLNQTALSSDLAGYRLYSNDAQLNLDIEGVYDDLINNGVATTTNITDAINTEVTNRDSAIATAKGQAEGYADTVSGNAYTDATQYTDSAITNLNLSGTYDALGAADTAESNAKSYADGLINDASITSTNNWSAYKTSTEIGLAQAAAEDYTDTAVGNIVGAAPELLDTLQELAAALQDNPDVIQNIQDVAAGKQDTLTAGEGIYIDGDSVITGRQQSGGGLKFVFNEAAIDRNTVDAWYDAAGSATTAQQNAESNAADYTNTAIDNLNLSGTYDALGAAATALQDAKDYADALDTDDVAEGTAQYFTDARAKSSATDLLVNAATTNISITEGPGGLIIEAENGVADSTTDDLTEGETNLYFQNSRVYDAIEGSNIQPQSVDITWVRREEATWTGVATASTATVHSFGTNKGSVKYLVRVISGGNSHVTELLATTDQNNNVAVVEYGTIYTSENPLATVTVVWDGQSAYNLNVTTANNNSEVLVAATLLSYND